MALPGAPGERELLERLATDPDTTVRDAVVASTRYASDLEEWRIDAALRAARSEDMSGVHLVLALIDRMGEDGRSDLALTSSQVERTREIVLATAAQNQLHSAYELSSIFSQLSAYSPRIAVDWIDARLAWLEELDAQTQRGDINAYLPVEPIPDEITTHFSSRAS